MQYIALNDKKRPIEKLSGGGHPLSEVKDAHSIGVLIPEPYVVFDFDSPSDAEIMIRIVNELDIKCLMMQTAHPRIPAECLVRR